MKRIGVVPAVLAAVLAACSGAATPGPTPPAGTTPGPEPTAVPATSPSPGLAADLLLEVIDAGGLVPPEVPLTELPQVAIYADGRMITRGPMLEIYPGPALPNLQVTQLTPAGLARIVALAREAGLVGPDRTLRAQGIADAPATIFTAALDGSRHRTVAVALGSEGGLDLPAEDRAARAALLELEAQLWDIRSVPGAVVGDDRPYAWDQVRIVVSTSLPPTDGGIRPGVVGWPLEPGLAAFGEDVGAGLRCGVLAGADVATLRPALEQANELTRWRSGAVEYALLLRPLLPGESGCTPAY